MLNLGSEMFSALAKFLSSQWSIDQFRDHMAGLRVDRYKLLADADRMFLNEFEGRYAEFCAFAQREDLLKASLALYVCADEASGVPARVGFWFLPSEQTTGSLSISVGLSSPSGNFIPAGVLAYQPA